MTKGPAGERRPTDVRYSEPGTERTSQQVCFPIAIGLSRRGADGPKSTRLTHNGHRAVSHNSAAKSVSAAIEVLVRVDIGPAPGAG